MKWFEVRTAEVFGVILYSFPREIRFYQKYLFQHDLKHKSPNYLNWPKIFTVIFKNDLV